MEMKDVKDNKGFVAGYIKGYITALEFMQGYCQDMIESKQKEFEKR